MSQGQSALATENKQRGLDFCFKVNSTAFKKASRKYPGATYFHFDLNAGSGYNTEADCIGSPLTFIGRMEEEGIANYHASFCDIDARAVHELVNRPELNSRCFVHHGDNKALIECIPGIVKHYQERLRYATGSILCDPNGAEIPTDELAGLSKICPRLDVVLHWNGTIVKRLRNGIKPEQRNLSHVLREINKAHWLIREPIGIHQFSLLIGRNFYGGDYKSHGYYHLESPEGQDILKRLEMTKKEYRAQGQSDLWD